MTRTFCIVTTSANTQMQPVHHRMPVILEQQDCAVWLGEAEGEPGTLLHSAENSVLQLWPVSTAVNAVRNNSPDLLDRIDDLAAPPATSAPPGLNPA